MNNNTFWKVLGIAGLILGLLIIATPSNLAPVCEHGLELKSGMMTYMKCHWTGQAEKLLGFLVMVNSLIILLANNAEVKKGLSLMLGALGVAVLLVPKDYVIGICANPQMSCNTTVSFLTIWAGLLIILAIAPRVLPIKE